MQIDIRQCTWCMITLTSQLMLIAKLTQENPRGAQYMETLSWDQRSWISPVVEWYVWTVHRWNTIRCTMFYFEQGGTPPHCTGKVKNCEVFPRCDTGNRVYWMATKVPWHRALRYFPLGPSKYHTHSHTVSDLTENICAATTDITP